MPLLDVPPFDLPFLEIWPELLGMGLFTIFLFTAVCGPMLAVAAETAFAARGKAFFDKFGLQAAQLSFWAALPLYGLFAFFLYAAVQSAPGGLSPLESLQPLLPGIAIPLLWAAVFLLYRFTWAGLKNLRILHLFFGFASALFCLGVLFLIFLAAICFIQPSLTELLWGKSLPTVEIFSATSLTVLLKEFAASPLSWLCFLYLFCNGFAATGCFILPWLIFRRKYADYGRDYYSFAMRHAALWAAFAQVAAMAAGGAGLFLLWESPLHSLAQPQEPLIMAAACILPLCCIALWATIVAGKLPLRHKPGAILACFLFFAALCAQFFTFLSALPVL